MQNDPGQLLELCRCLNNRIDSLLSFFSTLSGILEQLQICGLYPNGVTGSLLSTCRGPKPKRGQEGWSIIAKMGLAIKRQASPFLHNHSLVLVGLTRSFTLPN